MSKQASNPTQAQPELQEFIICKTVSVEYHYHVKAKNLNEAKVLAAYYEFISGFPMEDSYQWQDTEGITIMTGEEAKKPYDEAAQIDIMDYLKTKQSLFMENKDSKTRIAHSKFCDYAVKLANREGSLVHFW